MDKRYFDVVSYEKDDVVIQKYKDGTEKPEKIIRVEEVQNLDNFVYDVIFFESDNGKTFHVAFEYEPYDETEKKAYYEAWGDSAKKTRRKSSTNKKASKVMRFKTVKKNDDG